MSIWGWLLIGYFIWFVLGTIRFLQLIGRKTGKDNTLNNILISSILPVAFILGFYCTGLGEID
jgi:hypothetical protein